MQMAEAKFETRVLKSITEMTAEQWDALANPASQPFNPFVSHAFLAAAELSGSATARSGWAGQHLVLMTDGKPVAALPCYLKSHSMGEYVFDHGWAEAYARGGGEYYPKLQVSVPFTPAQGPRLLAPTPELKLQLAKALAKHCADNEISSAHVTFLQEADAEKLSEAGFLMRNDIQFHWHNQGYADFDAFLASLASAKRKNIRKERKSVAEAGLVLEQITGDDLREEHWDHFYAFYMDTGSRKWGRPYFTRDFFKRIQDTMRAHTLLVMAKRDGKYIAGALNFIGGDTLYGRNWGCLESHANLHFETCYYQAIDFAIQRRLKTVEAGAQGDHKLARGYVPEKTTSAHFLSHPALRRAVDQYLKQERAAVSHEQELLSAHTPFKQEQD
jgi:uncharacterized protein